MTTTRGKWDGKGRLGLPAWPARLPVALVSKRTFNATNGRLA